MASTEPQINQEWLSVGRDTLIHRGPDDAGTWWSSDLRVGLAHRRLSILDLSQAGHQPMHLSDRAISIVFNGEIYNFKELRDELKVLGYTFTSDGDTEVLLAAYAAWGMSCLSKLNGMFSFALYDERQNKLFLARDRAGEKPLFYCANQKTLFFASELKALLVNPSLPRRIDPVALDCYLAMGYVPGDSCILKGFHKLPPGYILSFDMMSGESELTRYWQLPKYNGEDRIGIHDENALLKQFEDLFEDAVGKQLIADVPVGVLLSGGVDSSLVTAMAVRHSQNICTFSIGFPSDQQHDETAHARLIANYFGTEHIELSAQPANAELIPALAHQFDEPVVDSSMIPTWLVSNLVRKYCAVALGGDGGDELFGGYGHHSRLLKLQGHLNYLPSYLGLIASMGATYLMPVGFKGRNWLQALGVDSKSQLPLVASYFDAPTRRKLIGQTVNVGNHAEKIFLQRTPNDSDLLQRTTRMDFENYMAEDILVKIDRASMMNSLELRSPMLDHRIIEFAFGKVPSSLKATTTERKIFLKKVCQKLLPPEFDLKRKQGFSIPLNSWLKKGPFRDLFWETLLDPQCIFDRTTVKGLLDGQDKGRGNGERLFALVQFELWRKQYGVEI